MSRNVVETMNRIFDVLKTFVSDDDRYLIADTTRHIRADGEEAPICDFVKQAKYQFFVYGSNAVFIFSYNHHRYLLASENYTKSVSQLGLIAVTDTAIIQGSGMLALASGKWKIKGSISSLEIVNHCLGIAEHDIEFPYSQIENLFAPYCVWEIDNSRFEFFFAEDINRFVCYVMAEDNDSITAQAKASVQAFALLRSSRSVAASVINSYRSQLLEYAFLQWYQCIEYLFRIHNSITISCSHSVPIDTAIDIVTEHELKITEEENLYQVLANHASEAAIDYFILCAALPTDNVNDKNRQVAKYIYRHRCSIAHLRYNQDISFQNADWMKLIEGMIEIVLSVYSKCDNQINTIGTTKNVWTSLAIAE